MQRQINTKISLNEKETSIRNLLVEFCNHYNTTKASDEHLELRITGGWVRDKLLGSESNDLDIAVNHLSGEDFAGKLFEYSSEFYPELQLNSVHTIKKNPEKSKHLETCTTKLFDLDIDFVNLRSEAYTVDSRVPIIEFGTPEEDALRRDATLNALFYNLNKDLIEDFTGKGLEDLRAGILRTPLPPHQTFLDDPLRVLRIIRFASRFNFIIEQDTLNAMINDDIKSTLIHKISRERVGVEVEKMFKSNNPQYGLKLINYVGLTESIFNAGSVTLTIEEANSKEVLREMTNSEREVCEVIDGSTKFYPTFQHVLSTPVFPLLHGYIKSTKSLLLWLSIILLPYKDLKVRTHLKKPNLHYITDVILKEGLRFGKNDFDVVTNNIKMNVDSYSTLTKFFQDPSSVSRSELGLYVKSCNGFIGVNLLFNCFNDLLNQRPSQIQDSQEQPSPFPVVDFEISEELITIFKKYELLAQAIHDEGFENIHITLKPIVDGKTLLKALERKPGPWLGKVNEQILVWQLDNPTGTAEECIAYVRDILPNYI